MKLVVARNEEDIGWTGEFSDVVIVQKGLHLPNKGREPSSYLWYIINHWKELKGNYIFSQGNPTDHLDIQEFKKPFKDFRWFETRGRTGLVCDLMGKPHDNVNIAQFLNLAGLMFEGEAIRFHGCCLFGVSAKRIKRHPKCFYENMYKLLMEEDKRYEYAFERSVGLIWDD